MAVIAQTTLVLSVDKYGDKSLAQSGQAPGFHWTVFLSKNYPARLRTLFRVYLFSK
jgi:hypothetical protein